MSLSVDWIADRCNAFDSSGIRKVFELAAKMKNPINLSIGQPDFDVPEPVKRACIEAIEKGKNAYSLTQGIAPLREKLQDRIDKRYGHADRSLLITSGTSGGLVLAMLSMVNQGDEVILFDPYFVMYPPLVQLVGGVPVILDTYPDFRIDIKKVEAAITPKTKLIMLNSPGNPTGVVASQEEVKALGELAAKHNIALLSDEIYSEFCYQPSLPTPADYNPATIVIDGFSKSHAMTGWRLGFAHGPTPIIQTMIKLQQYSFVCAPQPVQWAGVVAMDIDMSDYRENYRKKRDRMIDGLKDLYEIAIPDGAFYIFPKAPWGTGSEFVHRAIENELLIIPGNIFSRRDTHFRISYAAPDQTIDRGIEVLRRLAKEGK